MAKTIADYKKDYEAARARGDAAGMQAANDGANAIRRAQGLAEEKATQDISNVRNQQTTVPKVNYSTGSSNQSAAVSSSSKTGASKSSSGLGSLINNVAGSLAGGVNSLVNMVTGGGSSLNLPSTPKNPQTSQVNNFDPSKVGSLHGQSIAGKYLWYDNDGNVYAEGQQAGKGLLSKIQAGQANPIGTLNDYLSDQYMATLNWLQQKNPNATLSSYLTGIGANDMGIAYSPSGGKNFITDYGNVIQQAKEDYNYAVSIGDAAGAERAHQMAEMARQAHGYTGGDDGSQNIPLYASLSAMLPYANDDMQKEMRDYLSSGGLYGNGIQNNLATFTGVNANAAAVTGQQRRALRKGTSGQATIGGTTYYRLTTPDAYGNLQFLNPATGTVYSYVQDESGRYNMIQTGQTTPRLAQLNSGATAVQDGIPRAQLPAAQATQAAAYVSPQTSAQAPAAQTSGYVPQTTSFYPSVRANDPYITGVDDYGETDYSVLINNAMAAGASADEVQSLLNQRVQKALQNGYSQYAYDDVYQNAMNYINRNSQTAQPALDGNLLQQYMDDILSGYDDVLAAQQAASDAAVQQAVNQLDSQRSGIEQSYDDLYRQLYMNRRMAEKNLPQQLAAMGITGGLTESTALGLQTDYNEALRQGEIERLAALSDLDQAISDARLTGDINSAQQAAQIALDRLSTYGSLVAQMQEQQNWLNSFNYQQQQDQLAYDQWQQEFNRQQLLYELERDDISYDRKLQLAQYLFENTGDAGGFRELGFTDAQIAALQNSYAAAMQQSVSNSRSYSGGAKNTSDSGDGYTGNSGSSGSPYVVKVPETYAETLSMFNPANNLFGSMVLNNLASNIPSSVEEELTRLENAFNPTAKILSAIQRYSENGVLTPAQTEYLLGKYNLT